MKTKLVNFGFVFAVMVLGGAAFAATGNSAIQSGTRVRAKTDANSAGLYSTECYNAYYGCMDQFCILDNDNGGSCACSDKNAGFESRLAKVKETLSEANRIKTEEVERVQAGANADIVFNGVREYDSKTGDVAKFSVQKKTESSADRRKSLLAAWENNFDDGDVFGNSFDSIAEKTGDALHAAADELCMEQIDMNKCGGEISLLQQMYSRQIVSDCKGFENSVVKQENAAKSELASANAAVRAALKDSLDAANKYDRGTCMVEYKKCMQGSDACGASWENCVGQIASENMQKKTSTTIRSKSSVNTYNITQSTLDVLESKRYICERVLDQCMAVRDNVWTDFLRESAPTIRLAESRAESKKRQSCLGDISDCIQNACRDDIAGRGRATMDACLARPDMARSFCKVEIEPCERMEPQIWSYVKDKLAAMRVDACTQEVKDCFTDDTRCGPDFSKCIGMDYAFIHEICPIDKLVVCKQANPKFSMSDLDSMLMGLYLNIDNSALEVCQNLVDDKMMEICGSTTDCNKFAANDSMGTGSLQYQKDGAIHRISGMISFGKIKVGMGEKDAGMIDFRDYAKFLTESNAVPAQYVGVADSVLYELENIQGMINPVIQMIESDPKIQFCITGRNLEQITGKKEKTTARFPNLLNQVKMQIALAALRQAQNNYDKKYNEYLARAMNGATVDMANLMCNKLPSMNGDVAGVSSAELNTPIIPTGAIVAEFGGVSNASLAAGGTHSSTTLGGASLSTASGTAAMSDASANAVGGGVVSSIASTVAGLNVQAGKFLAEGGKLAAGATVAFTPTAIIADMATKTIQVLTSDKYKSEFDGGTREMWSTFNRDTRVCHLCTSTITKDCKNKGSRGFLGLWDSRGVECTSNAPVENCQDIQM